MASGMISMKPTSISFTGTSATIEDSGAVSFNAVSELSLNGIFNSTCTNYQMITQNTQTDTANIGMRYRASGSDATGSNYVRQYLDFGDTGAPAAREAAVSYGYTLLGSPTRTSGMYMDIYRPFLADETIARSVITLGYFNAYIRWAVVGHTLTTSYDGMTLFADPGETMTGTLHVFGFRE